MNIRSQRINPNATAYLGLILAAVYGLVATPVVNANLFSPAVNFSTGNGPSGVAIGDLAVANSTSNNVSVLISNGVGTFAAAVNFAVGSNPRSVAIGDLNGDGDEDLTAANSASDNVSVLLNNGDGTFAIVGPLAVGTQPFGIAIGDLDGDGDADLAVANDLSDNVSILLNNGAETFATAMNFPTGDGPSGVAIGDLNGDGDADLVVANRNSNNVSVLLNRTIMLDCNGNGIPDPTDIADGTSQDCNGNGIPDECDIASGTLLGLQTNGDFELGPVGLVTDYVPGIFPSSPSTFSIISDPSLANSLFQPFGDHTTECGLMMVVDGATTPGLTVWECSISVPPGETLTLTAWATSVFSPSPAMLDFLINNVSVGTMNLTATTPDWTQFRQDWNSGASTNATIRIVDINTVGQGNDFALDDISFGLSPDCNGNGVIDICDISSGTNTDCNANGIPDECEAGFALDVTRFIGVLLGTNADPGDFCQADANSDGVVNGLDIQPFVDRLLAP